jgi:hypothetical protein
LGAYSASVAPGSSAKPFVLVIAANRFDPFIGQVMTQATIAKTLVGPYGLHAVGAALVALFVGFLVVFNFTNFF